MKSSNIFNHTALCLSGMICAVIFLACADKTARSDVSFPEVETGFRHIPDSIRLGVYWYWVSDNISAESVERDLEAMKSAGIGRAFIGNVGIDGVPYGDVKIFTDEWWNAVHAALRKASELGIEIGMFNSPGWSQSGGPWIKPEESMRYLASADVQVEGGKHLKINLPKAREDAQSVRVIAYPVPTPDEPVVQQSAKISKTEGQTASVEISSGSPFVARTLIFKAMQPIKTEAELFVKEGDSYRSLKKISIDRSNVALHVGFDPLAPVVIALPETSASTFRFDMAKEGGGEAEIMISSVPMVERYAEKTLAKMFQTPLPMWDEYLWDEQPEAPASYVIDYTKVIDLTANVSPDGVLEWDAPDGEWIISNTAMLPTGVTNSPASPEATGPEVDKMNSRHVETHFDAYIGEMLRRIPAADRTSFKILVEDSYETGGQNWTDSLIEKFSAEYGYSPLPYLPVLQGKVVGSRDISDRFLWDLRRFIADRVSYDYVAGLREISHQHGLTTWLENYGHWGFPGEFLQYGGQSDEISGEFWSEGSLGDIENRAASSCGHIYGKRKIWAESCTSGGPVFSRYPAVMKQRVDRFFTEGINSSLLHVYIHQPFEDRDPGVTAWFGNEFNRKNTWFSQMNVFSDYLRRCNFMLQQGLYVADAAYFIGEDAPKMTGVCDPELPAGYSFDYINAEVLMTRATVKNGKLTLPDGMQYSLLVLPKLETMRPELLRKIRDLVNDGLAILGPAPQRSPSLTGYPAADDEVKTIANELWGDARKNLKGKVFADGTTMRDAFDALGVRPDFTVADSPILFIHRQLNDGDIYFVSNQSDRTVAFAPEFRTTGKAPELWNPLTTEIRYLPDFTQTNTSTIVPLELQPFESAFVIFRQSGKPISYSLDNFPEKDLICNVNNPWEVSFESGKRGPNEKIIMTDLQDWASFTDESIRYFSGTAIYKTSFDVGEIPSNKQVYIDLGQVMVMAKVKLNGHDLGGVWTAPRRVNATAFLQQGENTLEVEVVNNWMNRLIGDAKLPVSERRTWASVNPWKANSQLQPSGLLGPVTVFAVTEDIIKGK